MRDCVCMCLFLCVCVCVFAHVCVLLSVLYINLELHLFLEAGETNTRHTTRRAVGKPQTDESILDPLQTHYPETHISTTMEALFSSITINTGVVIIYRYANITFHELPRQQ